MTVPGLPRGGDPAPPEPVAIVGMAALYPHACGTNAYWSLLCATDLHCDCAGAAEGDPEWSRCGRPANPPSAGGLGAVEADVARFGIPPVLARSLTRMQRVMIEAARQCLDDAGHPRRPLPAERTDTVVGVCFGLDRQYSNVLRVEGSRYARRLQDAAVAGSWGGERVAAAAADQFRAVLPQLFGGSTHDRVGEMASTIPARIASAFKFRGRTLAIESADMTSLAAISHAMLNLRAGTADAALVVTGQLRESTLLARALAAKGLLADGTHPLAAHGAGFGLGEGVGALVLKRLSSALRAGDRIYSLILDCTLRAHPQPGVFRYATSVQQRRDLALASLRTAGVPASSIQYVECAGSGLDQETAAEIAALSQVCAQAPAPVTVGSVRDRLGHTFANAGLASVSKVALALRHRTQPPHWLPDGVAPMDLSRSPLRLLPAARPWVAGDSPRRAVVLGASLTGTLGHLLLEERPPDEPARTAGRHATPRRATAIARPEPVAVVSAGGYFAGAPDVETFWRVTCEARTRIGSLPARILDRDAYYSPGELSLTRSYADQGAAVSVPDRPPAGRRITPSRWASMDAAQRLALTVADELLRPFPDGGTALRGQGMAVVGSTLCLGEERSANVQQRLPELESAVLELPALRELTAGERASLVKLVREHYGDPEEPLRPTLLDGYLASGIATLIGSEFRLPAVPVAVEAACASSLAALDFAVSALRSGTADFAIAGGVELACNIRDLVLCSALGLLSHGRTAPFSASADGFSPGDGCALFLLKRYRDSIRDGDQILGLIRGIGFSNDAKSLVAPDADGQVRAMARAFEQVEFDPSAVDYLEAHGTGTKVGDRVEAASTTRVYGTPGRPRPLTIGSAKSSFGHTFAAASAAGLLRALLALRARTLPPTAGVNAPDPSLGFDLIPAVVPGRAAEWPGGPDRPRRAGVSAFATGGINFHVLVEEHQDGGDGFRS